MLCSLCEPLLAEYVDGTLPQRRVPELLQHLAVCGNCNELHAELRAIDALLIAPATTELPVNFTFRVMADVREAPPPHVHRISYLPIVGVYLAFAWSAIAAFFAFGGPAARSTLALFSGSLGRAGDALAVARQSVEVLAGHDAVGVGIRMSGILAVDALVAVLAVVAYGSLRTRYAPGVIRVSDR